MCYSSIPLGQVHQVSNGTRAQKDEPVQIAVQGVREHLQHHVL